MIEEVREEWMEMARVPEAMATKRQKISICCLGEVPVLNSILRIQLGELGYRRFSETTGSNLAHMNLILQWSG